MSLKISKAGRKAIGVAEAYEQKKRNGGAAPLATNAPKERAGRSGAQPEPSPAPRFEAGVRYKLGVKRRDFADKTGGESVESVLLISIYRRRSIEGEFYPTGKAQEVVQSIDNVDRVEGFGGHGTLSGRER